MANTGLQLRSLIAADQTLTLSLEEIEFAAPGPDEVLVQIEAAPINPSDLALLFGPADLSTARVGGTQDRPVVTADIPGNLMRLVTRRVGESMAVGNEGAGTVIATGDSAAARALQGKTVGMVGGQMYAQYRCLKVHECLELPEGVTAAQGASCFINPMTSLGMVETMRAEGHTALVHTAAASNLGQMLNKLCAAEGIELVNIVRKSEQEQLLRDLGARYVVNSCSDSFYDDLIQALATTGATLAFDATGGGKLAGQILTCMESVALRGVSEYDRYGSQVYKQVYIYGGLDTGPTVLSRNFGFAWGLGGWLLPHFLQRVGREKVAALRARVAREITTTFASTYGMRLSLTDVVDPDYVKRYARTATGDKALVVPN